MFIRIGKQLINLNHITNINLSAKRTESFWWNGETHEKDFEGVNITTAGLVGAAGYDGAYGTAAFEQPVLWIVGDDADAVREFFSGKNVPVSSHPYLTIYEITSSDVTYHELVEVWQNEIREANPVPEGQFVDAPF